jgi:uncharacterized protein
MNHGMRVLLFSKYPAPGLVKTRLARAVGAENAAALARSFLLDEIRTLRSFGAPLTICHDPEHSGPAFLELVGGGCSLSPQRGGDIGERMENAFVEAFAQGASHALLVGSDIPDLPLAILEEAAEALRTSKAVLGPARDGGYYLIGFGRQNFLSQAFSGIQWGASGVLEATLARFDSHSAPLHLLPQWADMDTAEDLADFAARSHGKELLTLELLGRIPLVPSSPGESRQETDTPNTPDAVREES